MYNVQPLKQSWYAKLILFLNGEKISVIIDQASKHINLNVFAPTGILPRGRNPKEKL